MDHSGHEGEIPIPIPSSYVGHQSIVHDSPSLTAAAAAAAATTNSNSKRLGGAVKYRECLKNHAAAIGGNATDGCGEFMPSGEEGSLEALKCSACGCHRNFHRKEVEGEQEQLSSSYCDHCSYYKGGGRKVVGGPHKGLLISAGQDAFGFLPRALPPPPPPHHLGHMIMPLGAIQTSESDEMEEGVGGGGGYGGGVERAPAMKKRFRTKFTPEQKEKMLGFAEKVGWRLQRQEEGVVQHFCQEIGVKRRVLKVWMHNNKHNLAKKPATSPLRLD